MSFYLIGKAVTDRWTAQWSNTTPTAYENTPYSPAGDAPWVRVVVREGGASQVSLGFPQTLDRHTGIVYIQVFVPAGQGEDRARWLADRAAAVFRKVDVAASPGNLTFRVPYVYTADIAGDDWWQVNVACPFIFNGVT